MQIRRVSDKDIVKYDASEDLKLIGNHMEIYRTYGILKDDIDTVNSEE
jgi:hypothetical protein